MLLHCTLASLLLHMFRPQRSHLVLQHSLVPNSFPSYLRFSCYNIAPLLHMFRQGFISTHGKFLFQPLPLREGYQLKSSASGNQSRAKNSTHFLRQPGFHSLSTLGPMALCPKLSLGLPFRNLQIYYIIY